MKIHNATLADVSEIYRIDAVTTKENARRQQIDRWVNAGAAFVALIEDVIVGYAVLEYNFFENGFITMLVVKNEARRKGVASALVDSLERRCTRAKLFTSTNASNLAMQALLKKRSYIASGKVFNLDEGDPELFFMKRV